MSEPRRSICSAHDVFDRATTVEGELGNFVSTTYDVASFVRQETVTGLTRGGADPSRRTAVSQRAAPPSGAILQDMRPTDTIRSEALALPLPERARLAREIIESLDGGASDPGVEQAWVEEIERRVEALDRGEAETESAEVAFQQIEDQRRRKKT